MTVSLILDLVEESTAWLYGNKAYISEKLASWLGDNCCFNSDRRRFQGFLKVDLTLVKGIKEQVKSCK